MIEILLTSSVLILALALLRLAGNRVSARLRYALWALVLVRLLLPAGLIQSPVSVMNVPPTLENLSVGRHIPDVPPAVDPVEPAPIASTPVAANPVGGDAPIAPPITVDPVDAPTVVPPSPIDWAAVLKWVWLAGACAVGGYFLLSNLLFYRKLRLSAERCPEIESSLPVYRADFLPSPCMAGLLRPAIYLNAAALGSREGLRHVLAHETCHQRHGDNWWALARCLCLALWWFDPLVWLAAWLSRRDCELACDESALKLLGEAERIPYGKTLVGLTARPAPTDLLRCSTAMTASGKALKERIKCLAMNKRMSKTLLSLVLVAALTLGLCTLTGAQAATPGNVGVGNYVVKESNNGPYRGNEALMNDHYNYIVTKEKWDTPLKELDPGLVTVSYPTAGETEALMINISDSWGVAFAQQFYQLKPGHPCRADNVEAAYAYSFYSKYKTASGGSKIINSITITVGTIFHPIGSMEKAVDYLEGYCSAPTGNSGVENSIYVSYDITLTRNKKAGGITEWRCTDYKLSDKPDEDKTSKGNYTPTALPVTVAPKEGWQLSDLDSAILALPDLGWNPHNEADRREMEIRAAIAFGQEFYALKPGHPYRASEVRILEAKRGPYSSQLIVAVKPVGGVEAVEPYFYGGCPKGVGELEGFVLLEYGFGTSKMVIESFGDKPIYAVGATQNLTIGPPSFAEYGDLSALTDEQRKRCDDYVDYYNAETGETGRKLWQTVAEEWSNQYVVGMIFNKRSPDAAYYETKLLSVELTGWSEDYTPQTIAFKLTYAFLPNWGAEAPMAYNKGQCTMGTGDLEGYVVRTIPVVYTQNTEGNRWDVAGLCTMGDGVSADSRWMEENRMDGEPIYAPPAGATWVTAN